MKLSSLKTLLDLIHAHEPYMLELDISDAIQEASHLPTLTETGICPISREIRSLANELFEYAHTYTD